MGFDDDTGGILPRRIPPQNIVQRLLSRELHAGRRRRRNADITARIFFTNVFPNYTVINVEKPACFLRKFSPDGRHLIAFSADQTSLEIYEFCGPASAADMLNALPRNDSTADFLPDSVDTPAASQVRTQLFSRFFKLKRVTGIAVSGESLNRECSLFTSDGRFVRSASSLSSSSSSSNTWWYFPSGTDEYTWQALFYIPILTLIILSLTLTLHYH